jgi:hypothetical protein
MFSNVPIKEPVAPGQILLCQKLLRDHPGTTEVEDLSYVLHPPRPWRDLMILMR